MKVEVYQPGTAQITRGHLSLWYGKSGVGKTASTIQTAPDPVMWILAERGQVDLTLSAISRPNIKLKVAYYEGWDDLLSFIYDPANFKGIRSLIFDSLTHVMNIKLSDEILGENYDAMDKNKIEKDLTMRVKMSQEGYGALSKQMNRLMTGFELLTVQGIDVHCLARDQENPKWDRTLACAPALSGREFPRDMKGFFDFIGLIESNFDNNGNITYPPLVSCDDDGSYLSKWTGFKPIGGVIRKPFHITKMMQIAHGETNKPTAGTTNKPKGGKEDPREVVTEVQPELLPDQPDQ